MGNDNLADIGRYIGLEECISPATDAVGKIRMATTIEAILAAVYMDAEAVEKGSGLNAVSRVASELGLNY